LGTRPFREVVEELSRVVAERLGLEPSRIVECWTVPREEFGDLSLVLARLGVDRSRWGEVLEAVRGCRLVESAEVVGIYLNARLRRDAYSKLVLSAAQSPDYGYVKVAEGRRIVVEYVSANPVHPLHIGAARNAALGQALYRMLEAAGARVQKRFYINDVGRQVAIMALGFSLVGEEPPESVKPDHWIGLVYAMTNLIAEVQRIRKSLETASGEERGRLLRELDERLADLARLREAAPDLFDKLSQALRDIDVEAEVSSLMRRYEAGDEDAKRIVRKAVETALKGIRQTLDRFGAEFDVWDWESDLVWSGEVAKIIEELRRSPYATVYKGAPAIDFTPLLKDEKLRERLRIPRGLEIPPLILMRSDETTLYTVRDIAYTLKKFREFSADQVINVIASEQTLPQAQLRLALYILGYRREAENLIHYSYEMVTLAGAKLSSRRGRIVTLDEILDEARERALDELEKRGVSDPERAERIGVAAVKFALVSVARSRPLKFSWENVLNFERNSAPYLLYTYARAMGIVRRAREAGVELDPRRLLEIADYRSFAYGSDRRWRLVKLVGSFPEVFAKSVQDLDPSQIASYLLRLADEFNSWYDEDPVLREPSEGVRAAKLLLTLAIARVVRNALMVLGIEPLERM